MNINIGLIKLNLLKSISVYAAYCIRFDFLRDSGWIHSFRQKKSIDKYGNSLPWMTYPFIYFLETRIQQNMKVFEYGCGSSTLWWSRHVQSVISCEHDKEWYEEYRKIVPSNVTLCHIGLTYGGQYSKKVSEYVEEFDIVVIDGRDRVNCVFNSLKSLKSGGIIIWDNSERSEYHEGYEFLLNNRFKRLDFYGIGPINTYAWCTSIFYRETNCLNI